MLRVGAPVCDSAELPEHKGTIEAKWPEYLERLSWWELKRYFNRKGKSVVFKPKPNVVVVHPVGRFTTAHTDKQWQDV